MTHSFQPVAGLLAALDLLRIEQRGAVVHLRLNRPAKRNAINDALVAQAERRLADLDALAAEDDLA